MLQIESTVVMDQVLVRITCIHHGAPGKSHELSQTWRDASQVVGGNPKRQMHVAASLAMQDLAFGSWIDSADCQGD